MKQIILDLTHDNTIEISEDTELIGLFIGKNSDKIVSRLDVIHKKPHLKSLTLVKAVVYDKARFDLEGKLIIQKGAKLTDAYLRIDVLLMSEGATARAVPSLEITEDDVKGGHGATIGQVDAEQMFYLTNRGLSAQQSEKLLIEGFVQDLLQKVKSEPDRKLLKAQLA
jgi:Fe-S cluster assembly protein SufD